MNEQKETIKKKFKLEHWMKIAIYLLIFDVVAMGVSYYLGLLLGFDMKKAQMDSQYLLTFYYVMPPYIIISIVVFWFMRLYRSLWRFASYSELNRVLIANAITIAVQVVLSMFFMNIILHWHVEPGHVIYRRMPWCYYFMGAVLQLTLTTGVRFAYRFVLLMREKNNPEETYVKPVMVYGAGIAAQTLIKNIRISNSTSEKVCCVIDDNSNKWHRFIDGIPIAGGRDCLMEMVEKYHIKKIYVAIPSATTTQKRDILNLCKETGCEVLNMPGISQLATGEITVSDMKEVQIEDLLGREPIKVQMDEIFTVIRGKVIMVTGGGGSIGSELCRQIAAHEPKQLIIFDVYENNAYDIQQELKKKYPEMDLQVIIGSVRDSRKLWSEFERFRPEIVYHAAAHKHVPLMEDSPCEAIKNNAIGTYKTAFAAMAFGAKRFVLISTDKAVNPTNIMGASKRLCEMVIQAFDARVKAGTAESIPQLFTHDMGTLAKDPQVTETLKNCKTEFVAVRFGNVLGSNGSVIPLFKKQIAAGGPVTVTHPDIIRYFMTIPEAVSLVLQAGTYAHGGEIFVLDMGEPVKIDDLARNLIKLSGHKPDEDIKIVYSGLRPGEKLYEEKLMAEEGLRRTDNELIHIGCPIPFDIDEFLGQLSDLMDAAYMNKSNIRELVQNIVTTYHPA